MSARSNERLLEELAFGDDWRIDRLGSLISAVDGVQQKIAGTVAQLEGKWQGRAAETALARLRVHHTNLGHFRRMLNDAQSLVTGMSETSCAASCANTVRRSEAQRLLSSLPSGVVPGWVHDAVNQGKTVEVPFFGKIDLNSGVESLANSLGAGREAAAADALVQMQSIVQVEKSKIESLSVQYDPLPLDDGGVEEVPEFTVGGPDRAFRSVSGPGSGGPGFGGGPGGVGTGTGGPGFTYPGGGSGGGGGTWTGGGNDGTGPQFPDTEWQPPTDPTFNPGGNGGNEGNDGSVGGDVTAGHPNAEDVDGTATRSGLGAAGIGAAGLAAGARLVAGRGAGLGLRGGAAGGLGQKFSAAGAGGLRGAASTAGAGGAAGGGAAGGSSGAGAARGMRSGGMMMGAGAGGSDQKKKGARSGLGYLAPKIEDEREGGPAADASRAGSREEGFGE
ncbi:hypothetical protein [Leucobacter sp. USHLN153]|uniref:hypothetical protein n=1 Tax=Leucobacter sp. USHLN153 TaxID=3081268 RepID=UPI0030193E75